MSPPLKNYVKTHRKMAGLSQNDIAFLLGKDTGTFVSRIEQNCSQPDLCTVLFYQILFNKPIAALFPGVHIEVEKQTFTRISDLTTLLEKRGRSPKILRRIDFLEGVARRIAESSHNGL